MDKKFEHSEKEQVITHVRYPNVLCIYINDTLHIKLILSEFIGLQSWYENKNDCRIELTFKSTRILLEYNSVNKWIQILNVLNEHI